LVFEWLLVLVVRLLVDVVVLLGVDIYESITCEYIKYLTSPNHRVWWSGQWRYIYEVGRGGGNGKVMWS
jgi:hypothetical protein